MNKQDFERMNLIVPCSDLLARLSMYDVGVEAFFAHATKEAGKETVAKIRAATHGVLIALREYAEAHGYQAPPEVEPAPDATKGRGT